MTNSTETCIKCGNQIPVNQGYITWCDKCNWNLNPEEYINKKDIFVKFNEYIGKKLSKNLFNLVNDVNSIKPRITITKIIAYAYATLIYIFNISIILFLLYCAFKIISNHMDVPGVLFGLIFVFLAYCFIPRYRKRKIKTVTRDEYPVLYSITDKIADAIGADKIDKISLNNQYNAYFTRRGFKKESILGIGIPLFYILNKQEKVALISHEIAHSFNKDIRRGYYIGGALNLIINWYDFIAPENDVFIYEGGFFAIGVQIIRYLISKLILVLWYILSFLLSRDSQRSEYYADLLASSVCGTEAMLSMLDKLHFNNTFYSTLDRVYRYNQNQNLFEDFKIRTEQIPAREIERIRRIDEISLSSLDSSHPPTTNRIKILQRHFYERRLALSDDELAQLEKELENAEAQVQIRLIEKMRIIHE